MTGQKRSRQLCHHTSQNVSQSTGPAAGDAAGTRPELRAAPTHAQLCSTFQKRPGTTVTELVVQKINFRNRGHVTKQERNERSANTAGLLPGPGSAPSSPSLPEMSLTPRARRLLPQGAAPARRAPRERPGPLLFPLLFPRRFPAVPPRFPRRFPSRSPARSPSRYPAVPAALT